MCYPQTSSYICGQAEVEKERKMDEERKSKFSEEGMMDRRLGVQVFTTHAAQRLLDCVAVLNLYLFKESC